MIYPFKPKHIKQEDMEEFTEDIEMEEDIADFQDISDIEEEQSE